MKLLLKNANIIPMTREVVLEGQDILVGDGTITAMGAGLESRGAEVLDCTGQYCMPGLVDMHVHLNMSDMINLLFANGVTTVRNMWGFPQTLDWKRRIDAGEIPGPRVYSTGPLTDGETYWEGSKIVTTPEEAERAVKEVIDDGYYYVKTYPSIPREAFLKLMETAGKLGIKVIGHGNKYVDTTELIDLGYYSLEHTMMLPDDDEDVLKLAASDMWFCPTLAVGWTIYDYVYKTGDFSKLPYYEYVNAKDREFWDKITAWRKEKPKYDTIDMENELRKTRLFIEHSERFLLGTDTNNPGVIAGFSIHDELELMVRDLRLSPFRALEAGTVKAAESLGTLEESGTLEVGKNADILLLGVNPLREVGNTRKLEAVIKAGRLYDREALDGLLKEVKDTPAEDLMVVYEG